MKQEYILTPHFQRDVYGNEVAVGKVGGQNPGRIQVGRN